mmetsp:Transcript_9557/g.21286  ORF Transcript_9557/g.21286 Transcript_9557/m.21286 type:complete len:128 (+) Transcript_9557:106-489(+)
MITTSIATVSKITLNECWIRFVIRTAIRFEELIVRIFGIEVLVSEEAYFFWDSALELSIVDLKHFQLLAESQLRRPRSRELLEEELDSLSSHGLPPRPTQPPRLRSPMLEEELDSLSSQGPLLHSLG